MTREELRRWLVEQIASMCGRQRSSVDTGRALREYGLSSRESMGLLGQLEDLLDRDLSSDLLWRHPTIDALADSLSSEQPGSSRTETGMPARPVEPIAVIGLGCRLPAGLHGPEAFWQALLAGRDCVSEVPSGRWQLMPSEPAPPRAGGFLDDIAGFDAEYFGISPREATAMDPQQRILLEVTQEAFEHAATGAHSWRGSATGVFVGISGNEYSRLTLSQNGRVNAWASTGSALSIAANRLSYVFDLRGPSMSIDTACSSSLVAVHSAIQSLRAGECEAAVVAGANLLLGPEITQSFDEMGILSPDGRCKPFSASANGIARAEGVGVVILKPLSAAQRDGDRILAVLSGSAINSDGASNGLTAPNPDAQEALLRSACAAAGVAPEDIDYVETHGTGTALGDPIEAHALGNALGSSGGSLLIGAVKSNLGHLEAAAGIVGLIKVVLALHHEFIPPSLHCDQPHPGIPFEQLGLTVVTHPTAWPVTGRPARAGVSAFGFGGTNAHVVVEQPPPCPSRQQGRDRPRHYLLAAPSPHRIRVAAHQLAEQLPDALDDVEHTLARRASGRSRAVVTARSREELVSGLRTLAAGGGTVVDRNESGPVWVFSGQGCQWAEMGQQLLHQEPAFADAIDEIDETLRDEWGRSLREILTEGRDPTEFRGVQPVLFGMQIGLARLWESYGIRPVAVTGHSVGEVAAAVTAGGLSVADGVRIAVRRSRLLVKTGQGGAMAVLELSPEEVSGLLTSYPDVDVSVFNAPRNTGIAGVDWQVRALVEDVHQRGGWAKLVKGDVASHSRLVDPFTETLRDDLGGVSGRAPDITFYPTALPDPRACTEFAPEYWVNNARNPVRFEQAIAAALADGHSTFVEISPHPVLLSAIRDTARAHDQVPATVSTMYRDSDPVEDFHSSLGKLCAYQGHKLRTQGRVIDLPATVWQHRPYWAGSVEENPAALRENLLERRWEQRDTPASTTPPAPLVVSEPAHPLAAHLPGAHVTPAEACSSLAGATHVVFLIDSTTGDGLEAGERTIRAVTDLAAAAAGARKPPQLVLVTTNAAAVLPGEAGKPGPASLRGLVRVLAYEHPALRATWVDLDLTDPAQAADQLARELASASPDDEIAWRGKVRYCAELVEAESIDTPGSPIVRPDGGYIITGGLGGLGLRFAEWLARNGAGRIVLNGRSGPSSAATNRIESLRAGGTDVRVVLGDIAEPGVAERLVDTAGDGAVVPRGVLHAAAVFDDRTITLLDADTLHRTWSPKAHGAWRLHEATTDLALDWWLGFSSVVSFLGLPGQPAYATANAYLDALAEYRRATGLPATVINWGTWAEDGAAAGADVPWLNPISTSEGFEIIELALQSARSLGAFRVNAEKLTSAFPNLAGLPLLAGLLGDHEHEDSSAWPGITALREYDPVTARELVARQVRERVASVLGWAPSELDEISPLPALGVDSLLAVRIRNAIEHDFALTPPLSLVLRGASVTGVIEWLSAELGFTATETVSAPVAVPPRDAAERLVVSVCQEVLGTTVGVTDKLTEMCMARHVRQIAKLLTERGSRVVTAANVRDFPSPELLAQCVRENAADEPVRVLRQGSTNPLFCFHPGGGNTEVFSQLASLLPRDVAVYGLDRIDDTDTVEQRVSRYLPELLRHRGPYRLIGWSFGGFLAFEAAQQLTTLGHDVELLALIDPILPLPIPAELSEAELARQRFERFADFLESSYGRRIPLPYERLASLGPREQADLLTETIRTSGLINEQVSDAILRHQRASHLDARVLDHYHPSVYSGRVLFYSAKDPVPGGLRDPRYDRADPARGWDAFCPDLDLVVVPGHHLSLLDPPQVEVIAEHLSTYLRRLP